MYHHGSSVRRIITSSIHQDGRLKHLESELSPRQPRPFGTLYPSAVKQAPSIAFFKTSLKTYLLNKAFWWFVCIIPWPVQDEHYKALLGIVSRHAYEIRAKWICYYCYNCTLHGMWSDTDNESTNFVFLFGWYFFKIFKLFPETILHCKFCNVDLILP